MRSVLEKYCFLDYVFTSDIFLQCSQIDEDGKPSGEYFTNTNIEYVNSHSLTTP